MKNLTEISKILTKKKVRKIEILDEQILKQRGSKFSDFYEALLGEKIKNDREAADFLYSCSPTDDRYRQLKSRFKKRLLNTLFFLDVNVPSTSNYERAYYSCNKEWTLVKILLSNKADYTAATLARQILSTALKFRFADVIVNCARILREQSATKGMEQDFETYDQYIKQYQNVLEAEIRSEELYQRVVINYFKPVADQKELTDGIDTFCDALVGLSELYDSPVIIYNMYLVWIYRYEILSDYEAMLEVCGRAEQYIDNNPQFFQEDKLSLFQLKKMSAYLHLGDFKNGKNNAEKALRRLQDGSSLWFTFMEYYLLLAIQTEHYVNALAIFNQAYYHPRFKKLDSEQRERWEIFYTYLYYLAERFGKDNPVLLQQRRHQFNVAKFISESILYPKDKRIYTVLMTVAQILFLLERRNLPMISEYVERLKNYANRQLSKEENYRTIQFIRLLQQLARVDFQADALSTADKYLQRLQESPMRFRGMTDELEIIRYEKLWDIIVSRLR